MKIIGQAFSAERDIILKIIITGTEDGIITDFEYELNTNKEGLKEFFLLLKADLEWATANEVLEELSINLISNNLKLDEDDFYIISLIENAIRRAILDYVQQAKQNYQQEHIE